MSLVEAVADEQKSVLPRKQWRKCLLDFPQVGDAVDVGRGGAAQDRDRVRKVGKVARQHGAQHIDGGVVAADHNEGPRWIIAPLVGQDVQKSVETAVAPWSSPGFELLRPLFR